MRGYACTRLSQPERAILKDVDAHMLQCVAVCCSVLQCTAVCCSVLQCVVVCCSVLQCVAVCRSVLQCLAVCCNVSQCGAVCSILPCSVCCMVLQCVAVWVAFDRDTNMKVRTYTPRKKFDRSLLWVSFRVCRSFLTCSEFLLAGTRK